MFKVFFDALIFANDESPALARVAVVCLFAMTRLFAFFVCLVVIVITDDDVLNANCDILCCCLVIYL